MKHEWNYDVEVIQDEQYKAIVADFKKVRQYMDYDLEDLNYHRLWIEFGKYGHKMLFTKWNTGLLMKEPIEGIYRMYTYCSDDANYNQACTALLVIAKRHLGHNIHVSTSESDSAWRSGIKLCQCILGHDYDLMDITQNGKLRFAEWELATHGK